ncbi:MAG TPA: right-handed parallel beta-helix repeat-containing protein, partial [Candidatus Saccharimonadales bacterium]|nr:right-handed parallel beta-helix repeat-containing protein [Candidatus Saccharimonadales bacterium]
TKNATYKLSFTGTQVRLYSEKGPRMGIMAVSIDNGPEQEVDAFATKSTHQPIVYTSPVLESKKHVVTMRVTGKKNSAATGTYVVADRVNITRDTDPPAPNGGPTYYVAPNGSDSANGSASAPWKTIQKAVGAASTGATIRVKAGTYAPFSVTRPGLTITSATNEKVVIKGTASVKHVVAINASKTTLSGMTVTGCVPSTAGNSGVYVGNTTGVTVSKMTIADSRGKNSHGLPVGCYGISTIGANSFTLSNNDIYHNGSGINVSGGGQNGKVLNNKIHDNDVIIWNTPKSVNDNDDYGGVAITFDSITASPGPLAQGNTLYNNAGPSQDYVADGGGFEIFKASNVQMVRNKIYNNDNIIETGTDGSALCSNNVFSNNTASGRTTGSTLKSSVGMILRCNKNMTVTANTLGPVDSWMFDIETGGAYGSSVDGLAITNNKVTQRGGAAVYAISVNPSGRGFKFSGNKYHYEGSFAWGWNNSAIKTLADWQKATNLDKDSTKF